MEYFRTQIDMVSFFYFAKSIYFTELIQIYSISYRNDVCNVNHNILSLSFVIVWSSLSRQLLPLTVVLFVFTVICIVYSVVIKFHFVSSCIVSITCQKCNYQQLPRQLFSIIMCMKVTTSSPLYNICSGALFYSAIVVSALVRDTDSITSAHVKL